MPLGILLSFGHDTYSTLNIPVDAIATRVFRAQNSRDRHERIPACVWISGGAPASRRSTGERGSDQ